MLFASQALLVLMFAGPGEPRHGDFGSETLKVGDAKREYRLVVPKTVDLSKPAPLVVAFHGMLIDSKEVMPQYTKLNETAEKNGFIIAYPDAIGKSWGIAPEKVKYVELKTVGHMWGTKAGVNETIWKFFADHLLRRKYEPSSGDQR